MPTYEYECKACGHKFEEWQSITAKPIKKCPACGKSKANRLLGTGGAIIFKGSGWYSTDYRSDSYKKAEKADSEKSTTKSDESSSKSESKSTGDTKPAKESSSTTPSKKSTPKKSDA